ncbi:hypothetical protein H8K47_12175 [Undibacterium sp. CY7W]|uniref:Uncharacterized protein n=1 Tax=Undibacterium rugosum TaxID=2762291 RepID=A0A923I2Y0_9BURK|nr:hypothetical protein [Undibacterium rugosum]MBC3936122.1 hypothetical protein [Undibacterium rugosum]
MPAPASTTFDLHLPASAAPMQRKHSKKRALYLTQIVVAQCYQQRLRALLIQLCGLQLNYLRTQAADHGCATRFLISSEVNPKLFFPLLMRELPSAEFGKISQIFVERY